MKEPEMFPVIQSDRDAASMLMVACGSEIDAAPQGVREGDYDRAAIVQAFARYRRVVEAGPRSLRDYRT